MDDDDLTFGTSVWGTPSDPTSLPKPTTATSTVFTASIITGKSDTFDDFDDFGGPVQSVSTETEGDDDFGDFGSFGDEQGEAIQGFEEGDFVEHIQDPGPSRPTWMPLRLDPMPSRAQLQKQVGDLLAPILGNEDISQVTTDENIREVEGIGQILTTPGSVELYKMLTGPPPPLKPPNWKQSRIRRQHLIALGIPVNLDEVLPRTNGKQLPPLHITTRTASVPPPDSTNAAQPESAPGISRARSGAPQGGLKPAPSHFGPKPELDEKKISELLNLKQASLSLLPLATLDRHLADIRAQTAQTSALLKHLLQTREALQQDSETYNRLIGELVGEAQKMKSGKGRPRYK